MHDRTLLVDKDMKILSSLVSTSRGFISEIKSLRLYSLSRVLCNVTELIATSTTIKFTLCAIRISQQDDNKRAVTLLGPPPHQMHFFGAVSPSAHFTTLVLSPSMGELPFYDPLLLLIDMTWPKVKDPHPLAAVKSTFYDRGCRP